MSNWKSVCFIFVLALVCVSAFGQQTADPNFKPKVVRPAYTKTHPKVLFDEAHNNFHTATGRYKPFADLITEDGYLVTPNKEKFQKKTLEGYDVLIIANALGAEKASDLEASQPAFTNEECDALRDWVRAGGSLLLIADHAPFGAAAEILSGRFGVDMSKGFTSDKAHFDEASGNQSILVFTRENKLLIVHPITEGRDATERINRVMTFTGQSLKAADASMAFLKLSDTAIDTAAPSAADRAAAIARARAASASGESATRLPNGDPLPSGAIAVRLPEGKKVSAAGRAQAVVLKFGKGRVVVLGEAAMLTAQLIGQEKKPFGMNIPNIDNQQLGLNIMHWLTGLLK